MEIILLKPLKTRNSKVNRSVWIFNQEVAGLAASDVDGIRRGIFYLEDEMLRQRGPFLHLGKVENHPIIKRRISRCFFGPIKRAPKMRDELMDNVNYYPDQYLNRLAHEGVNGLWLTVEFRDLVATSFTPEAGINSEKRLAKTSTNCRIMPSIWYTHIHLLYRTSGHGMPAIQC